MSIVSTIQNKVNQFFSGNERSVKAKKNIIASFIIKGFSIVLGFYSVRIILDYLGQDKYGIWLTVASFLTWYSFFELGLGNGLRNKLAESLAKKNYSRGREYVSTTYFLISIISLIGLSVFLFVNQFINWNKILNTNLVSEQQLYVLTNIVFGLFFVQFSFKLITKILFADQKPAFANAFDPFFNLVKLLLIIWLASFSKENLVYVGLAFSITPIIVYLIVSLVLFFKIYHPIRPGIKFINLKLSKGLLGLGMGFFFIGIGNVVILQLVNLLIIQYFGPQEVTMYNVAYKLFFMPSMAFTIITSPLWSAYTEAWVNKDIPWIKHNIRKMKMILFYIYLGTLLLLVFYQKVINIWLVEDIKVPFILALILYLHSLYTDFGRIYLQFTNGVSKLYIQLITTTVGAIMFIPLSYLFCKGLGFGVWGIPLAVILSNIKYLFAFIQYRKIIRFKASAIWNR